MKNEILALVTHHKRHLDEHAGVAILHEYGADHFGITRDTPVHFIGATGHLSWDDDELRSLMATFGYDEESLPCDLEADQLEEHCGILFLGTGGGRFDEHPGDDEDDRDRVNTSSVRLIADELGDAVPVGLIDFVDYCHEEDARPVKKYCGPMELSQLIRMMQIRQCADEEIHRLVKLIMLGRAAINKFAQPEDVADVDAVYQATMKFMKQRFGEEGHEYAGASPRALAQELGCDKNPSLKQILTYCDRVEHRLGEDKTEMYELATLPGLVGASDFAQSCDDDLAWMGNPESLLFWLIAHRYEEQYYFHEVLRPEYDACKRLETVTVNRGTLCISFIESSTYGLDRPARYFDRAGIIVIRNPETGHVVILTNWNVLKNKQMGYVDGNNQHKTHLNTLIRVIRMRERKLSYPGVSFRYDRRELESAGTVQGARNWYHDPRVPSALNGSHSAPNVRPTMIPWDELIQIVLQVFDNDVMHEECQVTNRCIGSSCELYTMSLSRCFELRARSRSVHEVFEDNEFDDDLIPDTNGGIAAAC